MEEEISLKDIIGVLRKRLWLIVLITALSVAVSGIVSYFLIEPTYESYTTLMVGKPRQNYVDPNAPVSYQEVQTNRLLVPTYRELARSRTVLESVIKDQGLNITTEQLRDKVDVSLVGDTEIIQIKVTDKNPILAATLANAIADSFMSQVVSIMKVENVQVIDRALPESEPVSPKPLLNMAIAFLLGMMISVFLAFVIEYMDNTFKSPEDISSYLGLPVIGTIPYIENKGEA
ncbi:MAG: Wzz/FepE/Etk N-terminal domain-containing protein [Thermoanaerobacteraceae bacterium]|nr:Wzz/FepE/Etk N-terminal domain-containing protein [Thermoanaerobacteraceae bacterium]